MTTVGTLQQRHDRPDEIAHPDAKVICVPLDDPRWDQVRDLEDMPTHLRSEIHHFFDVYKALEPGKSASTTGFEGREAALGEIAAYRARLAHQPRTGAAASQDVPREPAPVAGSLMMDAVSRSGRRQGPDVPDEKGLRAVMAGHMPGSSGGPRTVSSIVTWLRRRGCPRTGPARMRARFTSSCGTASRRTEQIWAVSGGLGM